MGRFTLAAMSNLLHEWRTYLLEVRLASPRTVSRYLDGMEEFEAFLREEKAGGDVALDTMTKDDLIRYLRSRTRRSTSPSRATWNLRLAALRAFYSWLVKEERIMSNPALKVDRLRVSPREPLPLSLDEAIRLVDTIEKNAELLYRTRNVALVQVLLHCSVRVTELVSLNLDQVDMEAYAFSAVRVKGDKVLAVVFNDIVAEALERYALDRAGMNVPPQERALFVSHLRRRMSVRAVQEMVGSYAKMAGIMRPVYPHLLRHSSATQLVELGTPMSVVRDICGHSSVTTTERYVHVNGGQRRQAVTALGEAWRKRRRAVHHEARTTTSGKEVETLA